jgi:hypothetical protein
MMGGESEGGMMGMKSKMMPDGKEMEMPMMPQMMMDMMPRCLSVMLPNIPKDKRIDFILKMVATLMEDGSVDLSEEEKETFIQKVIKQVKA